VTGSEQLTDVRSQLEPIRAGALAEAERRLRGLTETERELLESTTLRLVDEFLRILERIDVLLPAGGESCQPTVSGAGQARSPMVDDESGGLT
jgi:glutamyl-tRNA reductase